MINTIWRVDYMQVVSWSMLADCSSKSPNTDGCCWIPRPQYENREHRRGPP